MSVAHWLLSVLRLMKRVDVVDAGDVSDAANRHLSIFYTGLYRGLTFPRRLDELTSGGMLSLVLLCCPCSIDSD